MRFFTYNVKHLIIDELKEFFTYHTKIGVIINIVQSLPDY
jgi:hypothetical protein